MKNKAFTLIELLVVIAIISLLVSILLPSLKTAKELAQKAACLSSLKNLGLAQNIYASDNDGWYTNNKIAVGSYPDYYSEHKRYSFRESQGWVNNGLLVRDGYMEVAGLFCPSGPSFAKERWAQLQNTPSASQYSHYSMNALYYGTNWTNPLQYLLAPRQGFTPEGESGIALASDCNTGVDYASKVDGGQLTFVALTGTNVAMWHKDFYNVVYLDAHVSSIPYDEDMFIGPTWYFTWTCTNWAFFNYVKGK